VDEFLGLLFPPLGAETEEVRTLVYWSRRALDRVFGKETWDIKSPLQKVFMSSAYNN